MNIDIDRFIYELTRPADPVVYIHSKQDLPSLVNGVLDFLPDTVYVFMSFSPSTLPSMPIKWQTCY